MLILAPANSVATKPEEQTFIQAKVRGSSLKVIHSKGHEVYVEAPEECQNAVVEFLDELHRD